MPLASVEAVHVRSTRLPDGALACRLPGAVGGVTSGEKLYVVVSNVCPSAFTPDTVT